MKSLKLNNSFLNCKWCNALTPCEQYEHGPDGCGLVNSEKLDKPHIHAYCNKCHLDFIVEEIPMKYEGDLGDDKSIPGGNNHKWWFDRID